jgi:hypothetical protein
VHATTDQLLRAVIKFKVMLAAQLPKLASSRDTSAASHQKVAIDSNWRLEQRICGQVQHITCLISYILLDYLYAPLDVSLYYLTYTLIEMS